MKQGRIIAGVVAAALVAAGLAVAPAGAAEQRRGLAAKRASAPRAPGSFTPSAADPRLAALFARGGLESRSFRFTPSEAKSSRAVTVAVRARSNRPTVVADRAEPATPATVGLAPIAYNLGVAVGWRRFAMTGDVAKVDLPGQPDGGRERAEVGVSYSLPRLTTRVRAGADRATGPAGPQIVGGERSYSLDLSGSYALTRNLDVTAGVRYRSDRERIARADDRRDSQAVYVGTAFRF